MSFTSISQDDLMATKCAMSYNNFTNKFNTVCLTGRIPISSNPLDNRTLSDTVLFNMDIDIDGIVICGISSNHNFRQNNNLCDSLTKDEIIKKIEKWVTELDNLCVLVYENSIIPTIYYNDKSLYLLVQKIMLEKTCTKQKDGVDYSACQIKYIEHVPYKPKPLSKTSLFWKLTVPEEILHREELEL